MYNYAGWWQDNCDVTVVTDDDDVSHNPQQISEGVTNIISYGYFTSVH